MSAPYPFPRNLAQALGEEPLTVVAYAADGEPAVVCVYADAACEVAAALALLGEHHQESFVVAHGYRYSPDGQVQRYDPERPAYAGELLLLFEGEWVTFGPQPQLYVWTHTAKEWECARRAMKHLLHLGRLSRESYLEGDFTGEDQGLSAANLDGPPHNSLIVAIFREAALRAQNGEPVVRREVDPIIMRVRLARTPRPVDDDEWLAEEVSYPVRREENEEVARAEEDEEERALPRRVLAAIARWWHGGTPRHAHRR